MKFTPGQKVLILSKNVGIPMSTVVKRCKRSPKFGWIKEELNDAEVAGNPNNLEPPFYNVTYEPEGIGDHYHYSDLKLFIEDFLEDKDLEL